MINFNIRCFEISMNPVSLHPSHRINFNIRCFEIGFDSRCPDCELLDKLQHKMFWNSATFSPSWIAAMDKLQHKMFWNQRKRWNMTWSKWINFNIRCFEIGQDKRSAPALDDKLQHKMFWNTSTLISLIRLSIDKLQHKMFWNFCFSSAKSIGFTDKLQHKMFWNVDKSGGLRQNFWDKLQHKMFWNMATAYAEEGKKLINFNIRCFEILRESGISVLFAG